MSNWKAVAAGLAPDIPAGDLERTAAALDGLERQFRPLVAGIPIQTEPAFVTVIVPEDHA